MSSQKHLDFFLPCHYLNSCVLTVWGAHICQGHSDFVFILNTRAHVRSRHAQTPQASLHHELGCFGWNQIDRHSCWISSWHHQSDRSFKHKRCTSLYVKDIPFKFSFFQLFFDFLLQQSLSTAKFPPATGAKFNLTLIWLWTSFF